MIPQNNISNNRNDSINFENILEAIFERFSKGLRIIGPIFAFALTTFVLVVTHAFFQIILPYWIKNFGLGIGIILIIIAVFLVISILFNYFLSVLVKPGSVEDLRRSKFYRKSDPLHVSSNIINLSDVFLNNTNKNYFEKEDNQVVSKNEVRMRLKVGKGTDDKEKEDLLINNANSNFRNKNLENSNNINEDYLTDENNDESFQKHIEDKLKNIIDDKEIETIDKNFNFNNSENENYKQEKEIDEYYGINSNNSSTISNLNSLQNNAYNTRLNDCKYCKMPKMIRSHHCTICGYCVFKMDHHCPWINNCIGHNNHRYFVLFLTHTMIGCLFVCLTSIPLVFNTKLTKTMEFNFVSVLALVGFFLLLFFNSWNWFLVYRGTTTIEFWTLKANINSSSNLKDFSMPDWKDNVFLVFGTRSLLNAIFVPSIKKLPLSGLEWTKLVVPSYNFDVIEYQEDELRISKINNEV